MKIDITIKPTVGCKEDYEFPECGMYAYLNEDGSIYVNALVKRQDGHFHIMQRLIGKDEIVPNKNPEMHHPPQRTEQEPVDYEKLADLGWQAIECGICGGGAMGYPQRTWVWLTDEERQKIIDTHFSAQEMLIAAETKSKEKNV